MANRPALVPVDESTRQLDTVIGSNIITLLMEIVRQSGITVIISRHDMKVKGFADCADNMLDLRDGHILTLVYRKRIKSQIVASPTVMTRAGNPFFKKYAYEIGYPAPSAMPAVTMLAEAPIKEPFPPRAEPMERQ